MRLAGMLALCLATAGCGEQTAKDFEGTYKGAWTPAIEAASGQVQFRASDDRELTTTVDVMVVRAIGESLGQSGEGCSLVFAQTADDLARFALMSYDCFQDVERSGEAKFADGAVDLSLTFKVHENGATTKTVTLGFKGKK